MSFQDRTGFILNHGTQQMPYSGDILLLARKFQGHILNFTDAFTPENLLATFRQVFCINGIDLSITAETEDGIFVTSRSSQLYVCSSDAWIFELKRILCIVFIIRFFLTIQDSENELLVFCDKRCRRSFFAAYLKTFISVLQAEKPQYVFGYTWESWPTTSALIRLLNLLAEYAVIVVAALAD